MLTDNVSFQIITKEVEVSDWKKKYEQGKQEVAEMRLETYNHTLLSQTRNLDHEGVHTRIYGDVIFWHPKSPPFFFFR